MKQTPQNLFPCIKDERTLRATDGLMRSQIDKNDDDAGVPQEPTQRIANMKLTDTLTPGTFNVQTALALACVSKLAYHQKEKRGTCKEVEEEVVYMYKDDVKRWANENGINENNVEFLCTENGDLQGFFCSWEGWVTERGKKRKRKCGVLAFRGSKLINWFFRNARTKLMSHPCKWDKKSIMGNVHTGFCKGITSMEISLEPFDDKIEGLEHLWICGHSLGGALGVLAATRYRCKLLKDSKSMEIYTFGQPMVGCKTFVQQFDEKMVGKLYRVTNQKDCVPACPLKQMRDGKNYRHTGTLKHINENNEFDEVDVFFPEHRRDEFTTYLSKAELNSKGSVGLSDTSSGGRQVEALGKLPIPPLPLPRELSDHSIEEYIDRLKAIVSKGESKKRKRLSSGKRLQSSPSVEPNSICCNV